MTRPTLSTALMAGDSAQGTALIALATASGTLWRAMTRLAAPSAEGDDPGHGAQAGAQDLQRPGGGRRARARLAAGRGQLAEGRQLALDAHGGRDVALDADHADRLAAGPDHARQDALDEALLAREAPDARGVGDPTAPRAGVQGDGPGAGGARAVADDQAVEEVLDGDAEGVPGADPVELLGGAIPDDDASMEVGDDHRVGEQLADLAERGDHGERGWVVGVRHPAILAVVHGSLTDEERLLQATAREFAQREVAPGAVARDAEERYDRSLFAAMGALGLTGAPLPEVVGGAGVSYLGWALVMEELGAADMSMARLAVRAHPVAAARRHLGHARAAGPLAGPDAQPARRSGRSP